ncbi:MAG: endolytic transglycosylase MltG [Gammaproteobacteria bacterium]|nr:endolytic transglycosylase MltG [Gammaproteobacteria bacterium]MCB1924892.1 endolytic transglycosylase MltG [Gammaproteobacteria bacterium]
MRWFGILLGLSVLVVSLGGGWAWMEYGRFRAQPLNIPQGEAVYRVDKGATLASVARDLARDGYIDDARYLQWYGRYTGQANRIRAGEYRLTGDLTPDGLLALLVSGKTIEYSLTLLEGWNIRQVRAAVAGHEALTHTLDDLGDGELMARLGRAGDHPEGRFFPDTYHFTRGTSDLEFLQRAMSKMDEQLDAAWAGRAPGIPVTTPYEALILASIVEKETGQADERPEIAGVFTRRLEKGMRLQTDPTVIYGMGADFDGNIRRKDLTTDTPYNTYVHAGLPPTPICMPGRDALDAAVRPAAGNTLYFVARGDGTHAFSATLKQHNAAVRKYQLGK